MATVTTMSPVALRASVPAGMREVLTGPVCTGTVLARFATAWYVAVPQGFGLLAVLARSAIRLPCGLGVPHERLALPPGEVLVGAGAVRVGPAEIRAGRVVSLRVARRGAPRPEPLRRASAAVGRADVDEGLLGRGAGLTPEGDDVLAGYLVGAAAYGLPADDLRAFVHAQASRRTTTLSAALLRHAAAGEAIPQVAGLLDALGGRCPVDRALAALLAVGHTSGTALARGLLAAAGEASARMAA
ncbi:MAG TPA: DUF2877 domain-containing protein [Jatrophihabitantaceae bacterium]|jgi:hypothetical protein